MKNITVITIISMMVILLPSCIKKSNSDSGASTYTIKGRMLQDCSGAPLSNYSLKLIHNQSTLQGGLKEIAVTVTDANGNFEFKDISTQVRDIRLQHWGPNQSVDTWFNQQFISQKGGNVMDLGDFYKVATSYSSVKITPARIFSTSDTLYIGTGSNFLAISPIKDTVITFSGEVKFAQKNHYDAGKNGFRWGIGKAFYDSMFSSNGNLPNNYQNYIIETPISLCVQPNIVVLNVK